MTSRLRSGLRLLLVLAIALLVPVKGTLAASGLLCHDAGGSQPVVLAEHTDGHHDHGATHDHHGADHGVHQANAAQHHAPAANDNPSSTPEACTYAVLCAVACATPTPPAASAALPQPIAQPFAPFPALVVAAPRHTITPLDRPPRSI